MHNQVITIHLRANWIESLEYWLSKIKVVNLRHFIHDANALVATPCH